MIVAAQLAGRVFHRVNPRHVVRQATGGQCTAGLLLTAAAATHIGGIFGMIAPLFLYMFCIGMVMPTASAMALANHPEIAGSASALFGTLQFIFAGLSTATLSVIGDGSAVPMAGVIAACGFVALVCGRFMPDPQAAFSVP
jgi:DHA1 family bicyclomycin/chloramphenicol resistance-like MFS transporter